MGDGIHTPAYDFLYFQGITEDDPNFWNLENGLNSRFFNSGERFLRESGYRKTDDLGRWSPATESERRLAHGKTGRYAVMTTPTYVMLSTHRSLEVAFRAYEKRLTDGESVILWDREIGKSVDPPRFKWKVTLVNGYIGYVYETTQDQANEQARTRWSSAVEDVRLA